jgi:hypothetical protein
MLYTSSWSGLELSTSVVIGTDSIDLWVFNAAVNDIFALMVKSIIERTMFVTQARPQGRKFLNLIKMAY